MTDDIRDRRRALSRRVRWTLVVYAGGFLEGTCSHVLDLTRGGLHAYAAFASLPLQVFFVALVVLDPLVAVLTLRSRAVGVRLAAVVMPLDVFANWYVNWPWVREDPAGLLRPVGLLPITLFGVFVVATVPWLLRALDGRGTRPATADLPVARPPLIRKDAARKSGPDGNGAPR
ncbi:hypothetical protein ABT187_17905 [Streptomyces sp. NPDC001817]|uniref:hypothetical protein n=1 Tax=Streptomyces sp. NPDC001817 TaxID=3154398 RepID=UPI003327C4F8